MDPVVFEAIRMAVKTKCRACIKLNTPADIPDDVRNLIRSFIWGDCRSYRILIRTLYELDLRMGLKQFRF